MVNNTIPKVMRRQVWAIVLSNTMMRQQYVKTVQQHRLDTVSVEDLKITQQCEAILGNSVTLAHLLKPALVALMKTSLSYKHTLTGKLSDHEYYLLVPLLHVLVYESSLGSQRGGDGSSSEPQADEIIEYYFKFVELFIGGGGAEENKMAALFASVLSLIQTLDSPLISALGKVMSSTEPMPTQFALLLGTYIRIQCAHITMMHHDPALTSQVYS